MNDVAKMCKISVPYLYRHFLDKEELAIAVMNKVQTYFDRNIFEHACNEAIESEVRLAKLNEAVERYFSIENSGCVFVNFVIETIDYVPAFAASINGYFRSFSNAYRAIFASAYEPSVAQSLADDFVSDLQGALIMTRVTGTTLPLRRLSARLFQVLNANQMALPL